MRRHGTRLPAPCVARAQQRDRGDDRQDQCCARQLHDRRVVARVAAVHVPRRNDRRGVVDRGTRPQAERLLREVQRVADRREDEHRDDVVEEDRRDRERDLGFVGLDHRRHRGDRRRAADRRADADEYAQRAADAQQTAEQRREDQRDGDRAQRDGQRAEARARDDRERQAEARYDDRRLQHRARGERDPRLAARRQRPDRADRDAQHDCEHRRADQRHDVRAKHRNRRNERGGEHARDHARDHAT